MNIYLQLLYIAVAVVYIVDLSGFTDSWRGLLARCIGIRKESLRALPPFDCGECMTFWVCSIFAYCNASLTAGMVAYCAALAFGAIVIGQALDTAREAILHVINKIRNIL